VREHRHGGGEERGTDRDEGDLPARHAAGGGAVKLGLGMRSRVPGGSGPLASAAAGASAAADSPVRAQVAWRGFFL